MKIETDKTIGSLLILGAVGVFIPYSILTVIFNYPDILREDSGVILTSFHEGGSPLIFTWLTFALLGIPLLAAYTMIGQRVEGKLPGTRWVTNLGIISGVLQIIGLLRWVFVVPVLAIDFMSTNNGATREAIKITFKAVHQFGGVLLGEHLGQLFTIIWTVFIASALFKLNVISRWLALWGYAASLIYLLAQAELLATVIPGFPVIDLAGFIGSTLWLLWLALLGINFLKQKHVLKSEN